MDDRNILLVTYAISGGISNLTPDLHAALAGKVKNARIFHGLMRFF
jgi:hypothetical protein